MKLIMLGPPGAGKGTQAQKICEDYNTVQISTGDILREEVSNNTELGQKAKKYMDEGELVPDKVILGMMEKKLFGENAPEGYILDGFPRTVPQARGLDDLYDQHNGELDAIIVMDVDKEIIVKRLTARRVCKDCNKVYNLLFMPPEEDGVCDECGGELIQRDDDKEETVLNRLEVYQEETAPLIDYYSGTGKLKKVKSDGTPDEVYDNIKEVLENL
jgi:adenylate kinase